MNNHRLGFALMAILLSTYASANILRNGGFETIPGSQTGEGVLPSEWLNTGNRTADTFSNDGSYGLNPSFGDRFNGVVAHGGIRWTAANSTVPEEIAQTLTSTLEAGARYRLSGWIHRSTSTDLPDHGGYFVVIRDNLDVERLLGSFEATATDAWELRSFEFTAPSLSGSLPHLVFSAFSAGGTGAYVGLDDVNLEVVPEPGSLLILGLGGILLVRNKRR